MAFTNAVLPISESIAGHGGLREPGGCDRRTDVGLTPRRQAPCPRPLSRSRLFNGGGHRADGFTVPPLYTKIIFPAATGIFRVRAQKVT